jgi:hypothetical protein
VLSGAALRRHEGTTVSPAQVPEASCDAALCSAVPGMAGIGIAGSALLLLLTCSIKAADLNLQPPHSLQRAEPLGFYGSATTMHRCPALPWTLLPAAHCNSHLVSLALMLDGRRYCLDACLTSRRQHCPRAATTVSTPLPSDWGQVGWARACSTTASPAAQKSLTPHAEVG